MATLKQKTAISKTFENIGNHTIKPMGKVMIESGYKKSVAENPKILTESIAWKEAMTQINYSKHLIELDEMASIKYNQDKDNVLRAKKMLFDLGDKFPDKKLRIGAFEERDKVIE